MIFAADNASWNKSVVQYENFKPFCMYLNVFCVNLGVFCWSLFVKKFFSGLNIRAETYVR